MKQRISDAAVRLKGFFSPPPRMTQAQLADALGVTQQAVSNWVHGHSRPLPHQREAIERITGVPADAWLLDTERNVIDEAVEKANAFGVAPPKTGTEDE